MPVQGLNILSFVKKKRFTQGYLYVYVFILLLLNAFHNIGSSVVLLWNCDVSDVGIVLCYVTYLVSLLLGVIYHIYMSSFKFVSITALK